MYVCGICEFVIVWLFKEGMICEIDIYIYFSLWFVNYFKDF